MKNRKSVNLSKYENSWYKAGNILKRISWYLINHFIFKSGLPFPSKIKCVLLKMFGAQLGKNIVIKPSVNIKYPWFLKIGDNVWIGENVWIDNLTHVNIGSNVCISQGVYILTGNHNFKKETFDLIIKPVIIEDGAWIGAMSVICPGVKISSHSVITVCSVVTKDTLPYMIYRGNPAKPYKEREIE